MNLNPHLTLHIRINSKWIKDLHVKYKTTEYWSKIHPGVGRDSLTQNPEAIQEKADKFHL